MKRFVFCTLGFCLLLFSLTPNLVRALTNPNPNPPKTPVRLIFIHHSTGQNWLDDGNGGLGIVLRDNNYFVSDTNYGWGPNSIGDHTDIGNWWDWFRAPNSSTYLTSLYAESGQHSSYSRLTTQPDGENEIIMFKSCFPNSALKGNPDDTVPPIGNNPLKGEESGSEYHTVANAKGIYIDLLNYFSTRQDKLFVVIAAPPLSDSTYAANARAFNQWLVNDWLANYQYKNVAVFDFYNVLTTNGGDASTNDLNKDTGNHHRWWNGAIQHKTDSGSNVLKYPSGDDHPSRAGNLKATGEFLSLLNIFYHQWKNDTSPPIGTVAINGGSPYTNARKVVLTLSASSDNSKVTSMRFSNDNNTWTNWEKYGKKRGWKLTDDDGAKEVYVQFRDAARIVSSPCSANITLDTSKPTGSITINGSATLTNSRLVNLTLSASDTGSGVVLMRFMSPLTSWEPYAATKTGFKLSATNGMKKVFVQFKDAAGNVSQFYSTIRLDTTAPSLTIKKPAVLPTGTTVTTISGTREKNAVVTVSATLPAIAGTVVHPTVGRWSCEIDNLAQGANNVTVTATDAAGNTTTKTAVVTVK
jgi:hypothetical protein